jgi:hypothetical protein
VVAPDDSDKFLTRNRSAGLDYWRVASPMLACAALGLIWLAVLHQFFYAMAPRMSHLGPGGLRINDRPCESPECDFSAFWPAGLLARAHRTADIYQTFVFLNFRHQLFSPAAGLVPWFYPPPTLLPSVVISYLPFETGFVVWSLGFSLITILLLRRAALPWSVIAAGLLSPAALWNLELGQFGTILAGFQLFWLLMAETAPWRGGAVSGLLVLKPQYGLLVPVVLMARRNWRGFIGCAVMVALLLAATTAAFGWQVWPQYFSDGLAVSRQVLQAPQDEINAQKFGVSVFWMLRNLGAGLGPSYAGQAFVSLAAAYAAWLVWQDARFSRQERMALTVFLALLATPYGYTDDMVSWSIAVAALAQARGWRLTLLDALFWLWPALCPVVFMQTGFLLTPVVVLLAVLRTAAPHALWPSRAPVLPPAG